MKEDPSSAYRRDASDHSEPSSEQGVTWVRSPLSLHQRIWHRRRIINLVVYLFPPEKKALFPVRLEVDDSQVVKNAWQ